MRVKRTFLKPGPYRKDAELETQVHPRQCHSERRVHDPFGSPPAMKMIPLLGKEGVGVVAVRWRHHPPPLPLLPLRRGVVFRTARNLALA